MSETRRGHVATDAIERLLAGDLVGDEAVLSSLARTRDEIHSMLDGVATSVEAAERLPHRRTYLLLNYRLARAVLERISPGSTTSSAS